jgi:hypothetical protein
MLGPKSPSSARRKSKFVATIRKVSMRQALKRKKKGSKAEASEKTLLHYYWPDFVARA